MAIRTIQSMVLGLSVLVGLECAAEPVTCPDSVAISESLTSTPPGWSVYQSPVPHSLIDVTFFDGDPKERESIVPLYDNREGDGRVARWVLGKNPAPVWMACRYLQTNVMIAKQLPRYQECRVHYKAGPIITAIDCN